MSLDPLQDYSTLNSTQFGAVGDWVWRIGGEKIGFTPWLITDMPRNRYLSSPIATDSKTGYSRNPRSKGTQD
eukprot:1158838-Pelagomonas_calceolata.AAC.5